MPSPPIVGSFPMTFRGSQDEKAAGYCDILLVADGYSGGRQGDLHSFDTVVNAVRDHFAGLSANEPLESPFQQFASSIRIWHMRLLSGSERGDPLQRVCMPIDTPNGAVLSFSNLARVAEIGLTAAEFFGRHPLIVFVCQVTQADRDLGQAQGPIRENAQGPFVFLEDLNPFNVAQVRRVLIHELGHTPLGRYLGDEYPDAEKAGSSTHSDPDFCEYAAGDKAYHGPEPRPRNVSIDPRSPKWQPWPQIDAPHEGAYEHDRAIFRFQHDCRMRCSMRGDFCPVCREELALGLLEWGHQSVGLATRKGMIDLTVETLQPWQDGPTLHHLTGGASANLGVFSGGTDVRPSTRVRLTVVGSSVPQSWHVEWAVTQPSASVGQFTGGQVELFVRPGAVVELTVRHNLGTGIYASTMSPPSTTVTLVFDQERRTYRTRPGPPDGPNAVRCGRRGPCSGDRFRDGTCKLGRADVAGGQDRCGSEFQPDCLP